MQGAWASGRRRAVIFLILSVLLLAVIVAADQLSKLYFGNLLKDGGESVVIDNFFYFSYTLNEGSAYGFLSDKSWAMTFFLILTPIAVCVFVFFYIYAYRKGHKLLIVALMLIIGGSIGNYIDRAISGAVTDFICLEIGGKLIFGIFNLADVFLSAGVVLTVLHLLFFDHNAIFSKKSKHEKEVSG